VDRGQPGRLEQAGRENLLWDFTFTLGHSRAMMAAAALDQKLGTLLGLHEEAFEQLGGGPEDILYDRMRTVCLGTDARGEVLWHPAFLDFARYLGFRPRLCRPHRAQTEGKIEAGIDYLRRNIASGLQGREPHSLEEFNARLWDWVWGVANRRVHGATREPDGERCEREKPSFEPLARG